MSFVYDYMLCGIIENCCYLTIYDLQKQQIHVVLPNILHNWGLGEGTVYSDFLLTFISKLHNFCIACIVHILNSCIVFRMDVEHIN